MWIGEQNIAQAIDRKNFPFLLAAVFLTLSLAGICIAATIKVSNDALWMIGGTELLIYLIGNAVCALVVKRIGRFVKRTLLAYFLHLVLLIGITRLITGSSFSAKESVVPIYGALVICFLMSMGLVLFIRQILTMLKDN